MKTTRRTPARATWGRTAGKKKPRPQGTGLPPDVEVPPGRDPLGNQLPPQDHVRRTEWQVVGHAAAPVPRPVGPWLGKTGDRSYGGAAVDRHKGRGRLGHALRASTRGTSEVRPPRRRRQRVIGGMEPEHNALLIVPLAADEGARIRRRSAARRCRRRHRGAPDPSSARASTPPPPLTEPEPTTSGTLFLLTIRSMPFGAPA